MISILFALGFGLCFGAGSMIALGLWLAAKRKRKDLEFQSLLTEQLDKERRLDAHNRRQAAGKAQRLKSYNEDVFYSGPGHA